MKFYLETPLCYYHKDIGFKYSFDTTIYSLYKNKIRYTSIKFLGFGVLMVKGINEKEKRT